MAAKEAAEKAKRDAEAAEELARKQKDDEVRISHTITIFIESLINTIGDS